MQTKSFLKIWLLSVNSEKFTPINWPSEGRLTGCEFLPVSFEKFSPINRHSEGRFLWKNFSKLTDSNQIIMNDFFIHYHLCKISTQINECIIWLPIISCNEFFITLSSDECLLYGYVAYLLYMHVYVAPQLFIGVTLATGSRLDTYGSKGKAFIADKTLLHVPRFSLLFSDEFGNDKFSIISFNQFWFWTSMFSIYIANMLYTFMGDLYEFNSAVNMPVYIMLRNSGMYNN